MVVHSPTFHLNNLVLFCFIAQMAPGEIVGSDADSNSGQNRGGSIAMCVGRAKHIMKGKSGQRWELNFLVLIRHWVIE